MITYLVCDQDNIAFQDEDAWAAHFVSNPAHTSHIGVGGDTSSPTNYAGSSGLISQVSTDPSTPTAGQVWVRATPALVAGSPIGLLLALTQAVNSFKYELSYFTNENITVRTVLI